MSNPQQPELARSRKTPALDPDATASVVEGQRQPEAKGPAGPVPEDNQPGHHPATEQDKPDLDAFAARLGVIDEDTVGGGDFSHSSAEGAEAAGRPSRNRVVAAVVAVLGMLGVLTLLRRRRRAS